MTLWARYMAGEPLTDAERAELLAQLESDPLLRRDAMEDYETHGMLRTAARVEGDADAFAALVARYVAKEQEGTRFVKSLQARIAEEGGRRRPTRRRFGRRASGGPGWIWGLIAAGALLMLAVLASKPASPPLKPLPASPIAKQPAPAPRPPVVPSVPPPQEPPQDLPLPPFPKEPPDSVNPPPAPLPPPPLPVPPPPAPEKKDPSPPPSVAAVAHIENGPAIVAGQDVETGTRAVVVYADGTRLELDPGTVTRAWGDRDGKRLTLEKGALRAVVAPQPADRPMIFATPHGEAIVLGTTLRLAVTSGTRLDVDEGKVRLRSGAKDVLVQTGHFAIAAPGVPLRAEPAPKNAISAALQERGSVTVNFGPDGTALPAGTLNDAGAEIDERRGYGWLLPNDEIVDPGEGRRPRRRAGLRADRAAAEPLKATRVTAGSKDHAETWTARLPDGTYALTICVGDYGTGLQGPHHVEVQGRRVIDARFTPSGEFLEVKDIPVQIRGGPLLVKVGGHRSPRLDEDGTSDTVLNYIVLRRIR